MTCPYLPYAITEAFCLFFSAIILFRLNSSMGSEHEVRQLRNMIYSYFGLLATDIIWALNEDGLVRPPELLNGLVNAVAIISVTLGCYFWFKFIEDRLRFDSRGKKAMDALIAVPLLATCAMDAASVFTGWMFIIDAGGHYHDTSLFILQGAVNYFYLLIPTVYSLLRAFRSRSKPERSEYLTYSFYMIAPLISGLLESVFPQVPLLALNIFLMILILFLMIQNMQIYNDALTGLNNRRRLSSYLEDVLPKAGADRPVAVFIMDINDFKSINDARGHLEGDKALKAFSAVLRSVADRHGAFIARYGGDEFCLVAGAAGSAPEDIAADIRGSLRQAVINGAGVKSGYTLTVSMGCAVCDGSDCSPDSVLTKADGLLYDEKKKWHAAHL